MLCPHHRVTIVQRSEGKSAVAGAAYQSGENIYSEYDQKWKTTRQKKLLKYFIKRFFFRTMPHLSMQIEKHFGIQLKQKRFSGIPS